MISKIYSMLIGGFIVSAYMIILIPLILQYYITSILRLTNKGHS